MDSVTQIALGGAVGYAVMGSKVGRKAIFWGAVLGTLPDLDVLIPYSDPVADFTYHRSFSHSLFVHALASPLIVWLILKIHQGTAEFKKRWLCLVFLCLSTHAIIDSFTVYGTQLLWPLSEYPFGFSNLFIIDPLVTLPLLLGLIIALLPKIAPHTASKANLFGLILSCLYMSWSLGAKIYIDRKVETAFAQQDIQINAYVSTPAPLNTFLWRIVATSDTGYYEVYASIFDMPEEITTSAYLSSPELLAPINDAWQIQRLKWFTKGLYSVREDAGDIVMTDLRMGLECAYVFNFIVAKRSASGVQLTEVERVSQRAGFGEIKPIFARIFDSSIDLAPAGERRQNCI